LFAKIVELNWFALTAENKNKYKNPSHVGLEIKTKNKNTTCLALFFKSIVGEPEHFF
jgi:hypothetical protein